MKAGVLILLSGGFKPALGNSKTGLDSALFYFCVTAIRAAPVWAILDNITGGHRGTRVPYQLDLLFIRQTAVSQDQYNTLPLP